MMIDAFHNSLYGRYGDRLPRDLDGYVHLTAAGWLAAPLDTAGERLTQESAEELAAAARAATREAEAAVTGWYDVSRDGREYRVAYAMESGEWDVVESFMALDDDAANAYAAMAYDAYEWYVLDDTGRNINGGRDQA